MRLCDPFDGNGKILPDSCKDQGQPLAMVVRPPKTLENIAHTVHEETVHTKLNALYCEIFTRLVHTVTFHVEGTIAGPKVLDDLLDYPK